jgi:ribokinase
MKRRRPKLVVVGSINMDLVIRCEHLPLPGETRHAIDSREVSGGKGANQAVAAARMGAEVAMVGRVGSDGFGIQLKENLTQANVNASSVWETEQCSSGLAVVMVDRSGENSILVSSGANGRLTPDDIQQAEAIIAEADMMVIQLEIPIETVVAAIDAAKRARVPILLNPAPALRDLPETLFSVDILCPNQNEAEILTGQNVETVEQAKLAALKLLERGVRIAAVTLGSQGVVVAARDATESSLGAGVAVHVPSIEIQAVDTTAAGDAFAGALATFWSERMEIREACRHACVAGALAATKLGAQTSLPWRGEVVAKINES